MTRTFRDEAGNEYELLHGGASGNLTIRKIKPPKLVEKTDCGWADYIEEAISSHDANMRTILMVNAKLAALEAKLEGSK